MLHEILKFLPFFLPVIVGLIVCLIDWFWKGEEKDELVWLGVVALLAQALLFWRLWASGVKVEFSGIYIDRYVLMLLISLTFVAALFMLMGYEYLQERGLSIGVFVAQFLFAMFGATVALSASSFIITLGGLIIVSISLSLMMKYCSREDVGGLWLFMLVTDILFCMGAVFIYGAGGTFEFVGMGEKVLGIINSLHTGGYFRIGLGLVAASLFAKMAAAPFHWWLTDSVKRAPNPPMAFVTVLFRAICFLVAIKIFTSLCQVWGAFFITPLYLVALVTIVWGNIAAVTKRDIGSMLIYSSIAGLGYLFVSIPLLIVAGNNVPLVAAIYIIAFLLSYLGAFAMLQIFEKGKEDRVTLTSLNGLAKRHPVLAMVFSLFMFSLAGLPLFVGFWARFMLLKEVALSGRFGIMIFLLINMAIALYYHLKPVVHMYAMSEDRSSLAVRDVEYPIVIVIILSLILTIYLGLMPNSLINWIQTSVPL